MALTVDKVVLNRCVEYIWNEQRSYNIVDFLQRHGLFLNVEERLDGYKVKCPLHDDSRASLMINIEKNQCNCFPCGAGGGFLKFSWEVLNKRLGKSISFSNYVNSLLQSDPRMRINVQANSVFKSSIVSLEDLSSRSLKKIKPNRKGEKFVLTHEDLYHRMKKDGYNSPEYIKLAILLLQDKMTPSAVYQSLVSSKESMERSASFEGMTSLDDFDFDLGGDF